eukprot:scaffold5479_cov199-Amphora_coffeaeformis.AAC.20
MIRMKSIAIGSPVALLLCIVLSAWLLQLPGVQGTTTEHPNNEADLSSSSSSLSSLSLDIDINFTFTSDPLVPPCYIDTKENERLIVTKLFQTGEVRNLLITGGGSQSLSYPVVTPRYLDLWNTLYDDNNDDSNRQSTENITFLCTEMELQFPGLRIVTQSLTGVVVRHGPRNDDQDVSYEYRLLAQKQIPYGSRLAVWVFRALTGHHRRTKHMNNENNNPQEPTQQSQEEEEEEQEDDWVFPPAGLSVSRVSLVETTHHDQNKIGNSKYNATASSILAIQFDGWLNFSYPIPAVVQRWVPLQPVQAMLRDRIGRMATVEVQKGIRAAHQAILEQACCPSQEDSSSSSSSSSKKVSSPPKPFFSYVFE